MNQSSHICNEIFNLLTGKHLENVDLITDKSLDRPHNRKQWNNARCDMLNQRPRKNQRTNKFTRSAKAKIKFIHTLLVAGWLLMRFISLPLSLVVSQLSIVDACLTLTVDDLQTNEIFLFAFSVNRRAVASASKTESARKSQLLYFFWWLMKFDLCKRLWNKAKEWKYCVSLLACRSRVCWQQMKQDVTMKMFRWCRKSSKD